MIMPNPALRILVVDPVHAHRFFIEKMLNWSGYYRVAPLATLGEALDIMDGGLGHIDVLIISSDLAVGVGLDLEALCQEYPVVGHAIVYHGGVRALFRFAGETARVTHVSGFPDMELIRKFMRMVEIGDERQLGKSQFMSSLPHLYH